jgi:hypothetical protein
VTIATETPEERAAHRAKHLRIYIDKQVAQRPVEANIIKRIVKAMSEAGTPITQAFDSEEFVPVTDEQSILDQAFNLDEVTLFTADGQGIYLTMGQEWDLICDYHLSLEKTLEPIMVWVCSAGEDDS